MRSRPTRHNILRWRSLPCAWLLLCRYALALAVLAPSLGEGADSPTKLSALPLAPRVFDLSGKLVNPLQPNEAKALVFVFLSVECPISNSYAPELKRLAAEFQPRGVVFRYVYPNRDETAELIKTHVQEYGYGLDAALRDPQHELVKAAGAHVTPEVGLFVPERGFVYRGRIDDRVVAFGQARLAPTQRNLRDALRAVLERKPILDPVTRAVGCDISEAP